MPRNRAPDGKWDSSTLGGGVAGLVKHLAEYTKTVDDLEDRLQNAQQARDYFSILQNVTPLWRSRSVSAQPPRAASPMGSRVATVTAPPRSNAMA